MKLDLGCGSKRLEGFIGVDILPITDIRADLRETWPWPDDSVDEVHSSHFIEHLQWPERVFFFNELYRVLKPGAKAAIITPDMTHESFYGDPTHGPPMSAWYAPYLNKVWRAEYGAHVPYTCDFDHTAIILSPGGVRHLMVNLVARK